MVRYTQNSPEIKNINQGDAALMSHTVGTPSNKHTIHTPRNYTPEGNQNRVPTCERKIKIKLKRVADTSIYLVAGLGTTGLSILASNDKDEYRYRSSTPVLYVVVLDN